MTTKFIIEVDDSEAEAAENALRETGLWYERVIETQPQPIAHSEAAKLQRAEHILRRYLEGWQEYQAAPEPQSRLVRIPKGWKIKETQSGGSLEELGGRKLMFPFNSASVSYNGPMLRFLKDLLATPRPDSPEQK